MNKNSRLLNVNLIFILCLLVHTIEVMFIRTDETFFAECFINKVFGIILLFIILKRWKKKWCNIGFVRKGFLINCLKGFCICASFSLLGFFTEFLILKLQGNSFHIEFFVTGFSLTGNVVKHTGLGFVLMCVFFNIINVWMEEGLFRGFFIQFLGEQFSQKKALYIAAFLFGLWHLVTPFRSLIDGEMSIGTFMVMSIGYVVLSMMMGIKWGLLYQNTGVIWIGLTDHFFNNCVVTNLLHVVSDTGVDEMQIARVLIGELTSFLAIVLYYRIKNKKKICENNENV